MKNISSSKNTNFSIKIHFCLIILLLFMGCSRSDTNEESSICLDKSFLESFLIETNQCVVFRDAPEMAFTILAFEPYIKTHFSNSPHANISIRFEAENASFESSSGMVYEDIELDGTLFSGSVHSGFKNINYTVFF